MRQQVKITSILLAALLLISLIAMSFAGCGSEKSESPGTDAGETAAETAEETAPPDGLPPDLRFDGEEYIIYSREEYIFGNEMVTDEMNGEIVNDAVFNRQKTVEDRLGVEIGVIRAPGAWGSHIQFLNRIRANVQAGDDEFQLVAGYAYYVTALATEGVFTNLLDIPYLNFDQPWWNSNLRDELTLYDQLYFASGDLSTSMIGQMFAVFFNKDMAEKYSVPDLYDTVRAGDWTYDTLYELAASIANDIDGDGKMTVSDEYGLVLPIGNNCDLFFPAFNQPLTARGESGELVIRMNDERAVNIADAVLRLYKKNEGVYARIENEDDTHPPFLNGNALLDISMLNFAVDYLRDSSFEYGIIPPPKYDENQQNYHTLSQDAYSLFCVPKNAENPDMIGAVTEAMAAESYFSVTPAFFETAMKYKYSTDENSIEMLDIIRAGALFNFGFVNSVSCDNMIHIFRYMVDENTPYASLYARNEKKYNKSLERLVEGYKALKP
ncbi:MAG TPA: extracellular solute-binding protein [Clostridiales bacterium]|nr:extracellular solute-binding protein [Clostridiales bacterium]